MMRRAIVAAALAAVSVLGTTTAAQARPADVDWDTCEAGGGTVAFSDLTEDWDVLFVCEGGTHDGQTISG
ncbi:hypothetical protein GCM10020221_10040 [Streptomyces thioluteus]|uniref:Secreted protein n=1 Tax=Streptomyces thioluteus TaxID=66431 RepID=A0ABN3WIX9_STRTU